MKGRDGGEGRGNTFRDQGEVWLLSQPKVGSERRREWKPDP